MKQTINLGAYGWRHKHWLKTFYPEDLPVEGAEDWRLAYYSNEFNAVLVPADYWQVGQISDCADWLDSVHPDFQFFVECHPSMLDTVSLSDLTEALKILMPQLSALVFLDKEQPLPDVKNKQFIELADLLEVEVFDGVSDLARFSFIEDELSDLRAARAMAERFVAQINDSEVIGVGATIIVNHPQLLAGNLRKFRSVLDIMGY